MHNILVITDFLGYKATGLVVQEYLEGLILNGNKVTVLTLESKIKYFNIIQVPIVFNINLREYLANKYYARLDKILMIIFKKSVDEFLVKKDIYHKINIQKQLKPDIILHFVSGDSLVSLFRIANFIKNKYNSKYFIHFLDPKPGLEMWNENHFVINSTKKILFKYINSADKISAINNRMLDVVKSSYSLDEKNLFVLPIPIKENIYKIHQENKKKDLVFSYFGTIYYKRDVSIFLSVCNYLYLNGVKFKIKFYGSKFDKNKYLSKYPYLLQFIENYDWVENIESAILSSDYLVDINANIDGDPFISSKLFKYLGYCKPILVFSNPKSASYEFAKMFEGVYLFDYTIESHEARLMEIIRDKKDFKLRKNQTRKYSATVIMKEYLGLI